MNLPFTVGDFLRVFGAYNTGTWPAIVIAHLLGLAAIVAVGWRTRFSDRFIAGVLAILWIWMGVVYHWIYFARINPAARLFAALFVFEGVALFSFGVVREGLAFRVRTDFGGIVGWVLIAYAFAVYPALGVATGHRWPEIPIFGAPCPTTIFTFGVLLQATKPRSAVGDVDPAHLVVRGSLGGGGTRDLAGSGAGYRGYYDRSDHHSP